MLAKVKSCSLIGLEVNEIEIEVDAAGGLPAWEIVERKENNFKKNVEKRYK